MVDPLELVQEREEVAARVVEAPTAAATGGEELVAERAEVPGAIARGLFCNGFPVAALAARPRVATGAHERQRVDSFPGQDLGTTARGEAGDLLVDLQRRRD